MPPIDDDSPASRRAPDNRNADIQGQGAPIRDDAGPPEQGWRGEKTEERDASRPELSRTLRTADGRTLSVEEESGTAFAEGSGAVDAAGASDQPASDSAS